MQRQNQDESDRERWDRKYAARDSPPRFQPDPLLVESRHLLTGGRALDVACGLGANAMYLASCGYEVDAVDVSSVALSRARAEAVRRGLSVNWIQAEVDRWPFPAQHYDLVIVFFYLNRQIMPKLAASLRPLGLLFQANHNQRFLEVRPGFNPDYLLETGELKTWALNAGLTVLNYADNAPGQTHCSQLIARQP